MQARNTFHSKSSLVGAFDYQKQKVPIQSQAKDSFCSNSSSIGAFDYQKQKMPMHSQGGNSLRSNPSWVGAFDCPNKRVPMQSEARNSFHSNPSSKQKQKMPMEIDGAGKPFGLNHFKKQKRQMEPEAGISFRSHPFHGHKSWRNEDSDDDSDDEDVDYY